MSKTNQAYNLCVTQPTGEVDILWSYDREEAAQDAADMHNSGLAARGIPSSVSYAFVL
jgi:hypothetical protein